MKFERIETDTAAGQQSQHERTENTNETHGALGERLDAAGPTFTEERTSAVDTLLEHYLNRLCAPLEKEMDAQTRRELRAEMRAHLTSLAAAYEELGTTPVEALHEAFNQFGTAETIGASLAREHRTTPRSLRKYQFAAMLGTGLIAVGMNTFSNAGIVLVGLATGAKEPIDSGYALLLGMAAGGMLWKRRKGILDAALLTARLYGWAASILLTIAIASSLRIGYGVVHLEIIASIAKIIGIFSLFGAVTGVCGSLVTRALHRTLPRTKVDA